MEVTKRLLVWGRVLWIDNNGQKPILEDELVIEGDEDWDCDR